MGLVFHDNCRERLLYPDLSRMAHSRTNRSAPATQDQEFFDSDRTAHHTYFHWLRDADPQPDISPGPARLHRVAGGAADAATWPGLDRGHVLPRRNCAARL